MLCTSDKQITYSDLQKSILFVLHVRNPYTLPVSEEHDLQKKLYINLSLSTYMAIGRR